MAEPVFGDAGIVLELVAGGMSFMPRTRGTFQSINSLRFLA